MATATTATTVDERSLERIELRGLERVFSMLPTASFKIANVMLVKGHVREFVRHAPAALAQTFNKHPKMRAKQSRTEFATALVHPRLSRRDVVDLELLRVREVSAAHMADDAQWHAYVQEQTEIPFDRYSEFPVCLHVWTSAESDHARLFLFSDHYLSDGVSGNAILHDVLSFASALSLVSASEEEEEEAGERAVSAQKSLPLISSLYSLLLDPRPVQSGFFRLLVKLTGRSILKNMLTIETLITPRSDQKDFVIPPPKNTSTQLFASGTQENLDKLLARCKEEGTTVFGAATAAVLAGYLTQVRSNKDKMALNVKIYATANFRGRLEEPIAPDTVGQYASAHALDILASEPIRALASKSFWELARTAKQDAVNMLSSFAKLAAGEALYDQYFHDAIEPETFEGVYVPSALTGDANISSLGRYPHAMTHSFRTGELSVESLHFNVSTPFIMPATQFTITSVRAGGYGLVHHYDESAGAALFATFVDVLENAWRIGSKQTLSDLVQQRAASGKDVVETKAE